MNQLFFGNHWKYIKQIIPLFLSLYLQCGAPKIAKLVYNSNNYGLWCL